MCENFSVHIKNSILFSLNQNAAALHTEARKARVQCPGECCLLSGDQVGGAGCLMTPLPGLHC